MKSFVRISVYVLVTLLTLSAHALGSVGTNEPLATPSASGTTIAMGSGAPMPPNPFIEGMAPEDLQMVPPKYSYSAWQSPSFEADNYAPPITSSTSASAPSSYPPGYVDKASGTTTPYNYYTEMTFGPVDYGKDCTCTATQPYCCSSGYSGSSSSYNQLYAPTTYQTQYSPAAYQTYNEYYVQTGSNNLVTVAGVRQGEWLPLWSKVKWPGYYWSFEWYCGNIYNCSPEVKNFGYKNAGWQNTWFYGNMQGWHLLCYNCNDWSNYVYIYVWPPS